MEIVSVKNLTKKFKDFTAVDGITFDVQEGEIFGLLGPNGAGKTTTIRMLITLIPPFSGGATVAGSDILKDRDRVRENIGIVFQDPALDRQLTGRENLDFHARMYNMPREKRLQKITEVLELADLTEKADELVENYSGGMQRRLEIARGLMHAPKVLFLDEPTLGLDAQTRRKIWDYIQKLNRDQGTTILITTHYMDEADYLCGRVGIMNRGKIVALDTPRNLKNLIGADVVTLEMENGDPGPFGKLDYVKKTVAHGNLVNLSVENGERKIPLLMEFAQSQGVKIKSVELHKPSLEDVFLQYTGTTIKEVNTDSEERSRIGMNIRRGR
ncbi:ABC transporter ATP-binding protein [Candidatus Desantisbacteria bacterium CG_4_9_14_3_um_filter_50_7]|nr:MAG: ABC transporter ATP-binding protein [Candidatus Desantisbacteria bacterium CG_4_9_14_3_um_filter_50_7]